MAQYLLSVYNPDEIYEREFGPYESAADMNAAFAAVGEFNEHLQATGAWVFACGLAAPTSASHITPDGKLIDGPLSTAPTHLGGFWVVEVDGFEQATQLAGAAAAASGNSVEVRALQS